MRYGHFDDERREYVITRPDTPLPWINYLGSEDYFGIISNTAGGYSFYRDARLRRLTRYRYNNAPLDLGGRYVYLRDDESGDYWSPSWQPTQRDLEDYSCRHGLGYSIIASRYGASAPRRSTSSPAARTSRSGGSGVTNERAEPAQALALQLGRVLPVGRPGRRHQLPAQLLRRRGRGRGRRHLPQDRVPGAARPLRLLRLLRAAGRLRHAARRVPGPVPRLGPADRGRARRPRPTRSPTAGSRRARTTSGSSSRPGETREVVVLLGYAENPADDKFDPPGSQTIDKRRVRPIIARYLQPAAVDEAFDALRDRWTRAPGHLPGPRPATSTSTAMVNIWNAYQCMVTFNMSRSASLFESGIGRGMGFRDSSQDLLGFVHMIPARARERLLDIASTQLPTGGAYHQYQPLTKRGNNDVGSGFNDDPAWLVLAVAAYLKETGDASILDEPVPYDNEPGTETPLYEHLQRSDLSTPSTVGARTACRSSAGPTGTTASTSTASRRRRASRSRRPRTGRRGRRVGLHRRPVRAGGERDGRDRRPARRRRRGGARADPARSRCATRSPRHGWDGAWFRRAYDFFGRPVGSAENDEGQIFIEPQGMCVMAGIGLDDGRARLALDSVRERLATPHGIVLHQPAFTRYHLAPRRDLDVPGRLQGERRRLLPHEPVGDDRRDHGRRRRRGARLLPADQPVGPRGHLRDPPRRAVRLRPDDRREGRRDPRRGEELLADRDRRLELRGDQPVDPRHPARARRPADRPRACPTRLGRLHGHAPLPGRDLPDRRPQGAGRDRAGWPGCSSTVGRWPATWPRCP